LHVLSLPPAFVLSQDQTLKFETLCFTLPMTNQPKPISHRAVAVLTSYRALRSKNPKVPKPKRVALLKHSQRSFVRMTWTPKGAKPPEPQGPAACASLSSINNVKEPAQSPDNETQGQSPGRARRLR
jgi:hypothetical protein